jgi:multidrug efflux pump subunit AcrA (membrane-fusion protein)
MLGRAITAAVGVALLVAAAGCDWAGGAPGSAASVSAAAPSGPRAVTALGRLQPKDGIIRVAGPSRPTVVIAKLLVSEGDRQAGSPSPSSIPRPRTRRGSRA